MTKEASELHTAIAHMAGDYQVYTDLLKCIQADQRWLTKFPSDGLDVTFQVRRKNTGAGKAKTTTVRLRSEQALPVLEKLADAIQSDADKAMDNLSGLVTRVQWNKASSEVEVTDTIVKEDESEE